MPEPTTQSGLPPQPAISRKWLFYALLCLCSWGVFGFLSKLGSRHLPPRQMQVLFTLGALPLLVPAWLRSRRKIGSDKLGIALGMVTGLLAALANVAYFSALQRGQASIVAPITALYPMVTFVLAGLILKERMNRFQYAGVVVAMGAILLLSL